jgi:hypothetical protein
MDWVAGELKCLTEISREPYLFFTFFISISFNSLSCGWTWTYWMLANGGLAELARCSPGGVGSESSEARISDAVG